MRVLIACSAPRRAEGGVAGVVHNLVAGLRARGHQADALFYEDLLPQRRLPSRFETIDLAWAVSRYVASHKVQYDVVNIHAPCGFLYGLKRRLIGDAAGPPYVMTMHGLEERRVYAMRQEARKGRAWYFKTVNRFWHRIYHMPTFRYSIMTADHCVVLNREAANFLQLKYRRESERVWYIANGVERQFFLTREYGFEPPSKLLFVGSWLDHKGVYYLRDGFSELTRQFPNLKLTIAGCGTDAEPVYRFFPADLRDRLTVIPFIARSDMPEIYARHDIFVYPSLMEGLPLVLLEAMAAGMPVVTTDVCGMVDVVKDGFDGLLIKPADTAGFVNAVERLLNSHDLRAGLGRAAQETARRYTWDNITSKFEQILQRAVQHRPAAPSP